MQYYLYSGELYLLGDFDNILFYNSRSGWESVCVVGTYLYFFYYISR